MFATIFFLCTLQVEFEAGESGRNIEEENFSQFQEWKSKMNKHFASQDEEAYRFRVFEANNEIIKAHNALQDKAYTMGLNKFSDLTKEEFQSTYLINLSQYTLEESKDKTEQVQLELSPLPSYYDSKRYLNTPRNQGVCGSDWAFSTISSIEAGYTLKYGRLIDLSEQQLVDCGIRDNDGNIYDGCEGGQMLSGFDYFTLYGGAIEEYFYPYTGMFGQCRTNRPKKVQISGYVKIAMDEVSLKDAIMKYGSIVTAFDASEWSYYGKGIFQPKYIGEISHTANIIGWGEELGRKYYIIRNSWGPDWGENGYIRIDAQNGGMFYQYLYAAKVA